MIGGNSLVGPLLDADLFDHLISEWHPCRKGVPLYPGEGRFTNWMASEPLAPFAEAGFSRKVRNREEWTA